MIANIVSCIDYILYAYFLLCVGYIALFSAASCRKRKQEYAAVTSRLHRFIFLIPAYKEDKVICDSASSAIKQNYPPELFDVLVISDKMTEETNNALRQLGAEVLNIHFQESSKSTALKTAMKHLENRPPYDYIVVLDADNVVSEDYLCEINNVITHSGCRILQTHRTAKNLNTSTAMLDAAIEEMNNSIFRAGHVNLGFSSALIGSGMVMDYQWFANNIIHTDSAGEDKELEELLLRQHIHIAYADHICVYDEKVQQKDALRNQRRRWLATQFFLAARMWKHLPEAIRKGNGDYIVKTIQSFILPRSILLGMLGLLSLLSLFIPGISSVKWWGVLILLLAGMYIAIPSSMKNKELFKAIRNIPYFVCIMILNLFHIKGAAKKFIHTQHG